MTLLIVAGFTWLGIRLIRQLSVYVDQRYADRLEHYDDDEARRALTYVAVARRVLIFIALLVGVGIALSQLNLLKTLGISLLASAGLISVVAGVAAHNVLENIMAGIQIAITRPASIGDSIYFEKQWGYVEEITYTYITVRTWDQRRVVVPLKYFLSHPFENWSMRDPHLIKPIYLYVDYSTDVQALREKFEQLLQNSEDWDEKAEPTVQVTACKEETMEVRVLCSAKNPSIAWDLHCRLREELIQYIQETERGRYLPKQRVLLEKSDNDENPHQTAA
ncbi:MAG: mechanosensitive ion channel [Gammaproteobacteria bacterium]